jgi:DNA-3-methyladenine glycosylase II
MGVRRFELEARQPFRLDLTVWALRRRAHNDIDTWDGTWYRRVSVVAGEPAEVAARQMSRDGHAVLVVELTTAGHRPSTAAVGEVGRLLERCLGLDEDLSGFYALARRDRRLLSLAQRFRGLHPPRFPSVFEALVNAIACQQLSLDVGIHLLNRLARRYSPAGAGWGAPVFLPPPEALAGAEAGELRPLEFSRAKARAITRLAGLVADGETDLEALEEADDTKAVVILTALPGIGRWSAEYTLLRGLGRWHVLPGDDVGAQNNLRRRFGLAGDGGYEAVSQLSRQWWPYGGLVYFHLLLDGLADAGHLAPPGGNVAVNGKSLNAMYVRSNRN